MNELRALRRAAGLSQQAFAALLAVPVNSFRMWDSGLRSVPAPILTRARDAVAERVHRLELLPLNRLASELGVHLCTLQAAARTGRLEVRFSSRSVFGRPIRYATREAGQLFLKTYYRRFSGQPVCSIPLPVVPSDYAERLKTLRARLRLSQAALARCVGAAGKAVVYQWESRKRIPSPVFWKKIQSLEEESLATAPEEQAVVGG